jgi:hypothetical protein
MPLPEVRCNNCICILLARFKMLFRSIDSRTDAFIFIYLLIQFLGPPGPSAPTTAAPHPCFAPAEAVHAKNHVAGPLLLPHRFLLLKHVVSHRPAVAVDAQAPSSLHAQKIRHIQNSLVAATFILFTVMAWCFMEPASHFHVRLQVLSLERQQIQQSCVIATMCVARYRYFALSLWRFI